MLLLKEYKKELEEYVKENLELFKTFKNKNILVTGAAGLIGSYLVDLFIAAQQQMNINCKVFAVDRNRELLETRFPDEYGQIVERIVLDIKEETIPVNNVHYVFHAASNTSPIDYITNPVDTICTNIIGTNNLMKLAVENKVKRFLFCSSVEAYGMNKGDIDEFDEKYSGYVDSNTLRAGYPSAKRCAESLCNAYATENDSFEYIIARIGRIYGPTVIANDTKAPSQFINSAINSQDIILKSAGTQEYSYCYVGDCAIAMLLIMVKGEASEAYNIADPNSKVLLKDFAEECSKCGKAKVMYKAPTTQEQDAYSKINKATMNVDKLMALNWKAKYNIQEGLSRSIYYLKELSR